MQTPTLKKYRECTAELRKWAKSRSKVLSPFAALNKTMVLYFANLRKNARPFNDASYFLYDWLCEADEAADDRQLLPRAQDALQGWKSRFPGGSHFPIALVIFDLFALHFCEQGKFEAAAAIVQVFTIIFDTAARRDGNTVVKEVVKTKQEETRLFPKLTLPKYEALFRKASDHFNLRDLKISPHCDRHSAPSEDIYKRIKTVELIQARR
jgi:hypothetical protein